MDELAEEETMEDGCEFEPLPVLLEDEENVSLADVLSLWDSCLTEQDIWAICLECCQSLLNVAHSAIFQTLCITPDTLAFNTHGNVCFMEQISDDPEGAFEPPEIDVTGNTFEAHIFSLGATLKAAVDYVVELEIDSDFSQDLHTLLEQMQEEAPKGRLTIESVILLCEEKLKESSSSDICQRLSAIGRKVLSIESCGPFQDSCDNLQKEKLNETLSPFEPCSGEEICMNEHHSPQPKDVTISGDRNASGRNSMSDRTYESKETQINLGNERFYSQQFSSGLTKSKEMNNNIKYDKCGNALLETQLCTSDMKKNDLRKIKTFPTLPSEFVRDPGAFCPFVTNYGPLARKPQFKAESLPVINNYNNEDSALEEKLSLCETKTQLGLKERCFQKQNINLEEFCPSTDIAPMPTHAYREANFLPCYHVVSEESNNSNILNGRNDLHTGPHMLDNQNTWECCAEASAGTYENGFLHNNRTTTFLRTFNENEHASGLKSCLEENLNEMEKCKQGVGWNSEIRRNEQRVFLKQLLTQYGKPLKDYELWALCHQCLLTVETYTDYPAYLCLDAVLINTDGSILFAPPKSEESYDMFYVAPEIAEDDFVTEKDCLEACMKVVQGDAIYHLKAETQLSSEVCVYCIAAILWRAAKYNFPPDRKLVLPRKLKNFLLEMARRKSEDRPSLTGAIKACHNFLLEQGIDSKKILALLRNSAFQTFKEEVDSFHGNLSSGFQSDRESMDDNLGFLPISNESKLIAVEGPVPCRSSLNGKSRTMLPTAFISPATHFKPIILHQNTDIKNNIIAATSEQCETNTNRIVPVDDNNTVFLNVDHESQTDEDASMATIYMSSDALEHDQLESKTSLQTVPEEQYPSEMAPAMTELPILSDFSCDSQEKWTSLPPSSSTSNCSVSSSGAFINNFLLKQDPETRVLTLVPVQIAISEQIPNKPLHSTAAYSCCSSWQVLLSDAAMSYNVNRKQNNTSMDNPRNCEPSDLQSEFGVMKARMRNSSPATANNVTQTNCSKGSPCLKFCKESNSEAATDVPLHDHTLHASMDKNPACLLSPDVAHQSNGKNNVFLEAVMHLIQQEFVFSNYLGNTDEALAMGKYICTLKDLKYNDFCNAICEKFCDFYWEEYLLANLYNAANGRTTPSASTKETENCDKALWSPNLLNNFLNANKETNAVLAGMSVDDLEQDDEEKEIKSQKIISGEKMEDESLQASTCCVSPDSPKENLEQEKAPGKAEENIYSRSPFISELNDFCLDWSSAFYGSECYNLEVHNYVRKLGKRKVNGNQNTDIKRVELEQMIMMETKNYRKSIKFYQRLLHQERSNKGGEVKTLLPKLRGQLEEMKSKVQFLELVKKYLQIMSVEKWGVEPCNLPTVVNMAGNKTLSVTSLDGILLFYNISKIQYKDNQNQARNLQTGTPCGLMAYLYSRNAFLEGYIQQFLFTFRYFCTQEDLLQFLLDRIKITLSSSDLEPCSLLSKVYHRSFSILQTWIEDCYAVDFTVNPDFMSTLKDFITSKVVPLDGYGKCLLSLLEGITSRRQNNVSQFCSLEEWKVEENTRRLHSFCRKISNDALPKSFDWKFSKRNETVVPYQTDEQYSVASTLPKPRYPNVTEKFTDVCAKTHGELFFLTDCTVQQLCCQLTLLEQEMFHKCHPVHFLNSRHHGVKDKSKPLQKSSSAELLPTPFYNLFVQNCVQDNYLLQLLQYADSVSTWVAAEIVTSYSSKVQVKLLSKFLFVAKCCYEQRNFATAIQILKGLENLIVRQLPAWKYLPSKVSAIMEELKTVEVFLKSDNLCLMEGERFKASPTIPSAHILAMHIQQLETGGFITRNGFYKWTKLRNIAKVVSQVRAFQGNPYMFAPDHQLQSCLRERIASFKDADISALAADNHVNFHQLPAEKQSRKMQDMLYKMKAMFQ